MLNNFFHFFSRVVNWIYPCKIEPTFNTFTCGMHFHLYNTLFQTFLAIMYFVVLFFTYIEVIEKDRKIFCLCYTSITYLLVLIIKNIMLKKFIILSGIVVFGTGSVFAFGMNGSGVASMTVGMNDEQETHARVTTKVKEQHTQKDDENGDLDMKVNMKNGEKSIQNVVVGGMKISHKDGENKASFGGDFSLQGKNSVSAEVSSKKEMDMEFSHMFGKEAEQFKGDANVSFKNGNIFVKNHQVKVDVDTAKVKAKSKVLADGVLDIKLKSDKDGSVHYVVETEKKGKFLGLFKTNIHSEVKVDVETGDVVEVDSPWYAFLVF